MGVREFGEHWDEFFWQESSLYFSSTANYSFGRLLHLPSSVLSKPSPLLQCPINKRVLSATRPPNSWLSVYSKISGMQINPPESCFTLILCVCYHFQLYVCGVPCKKRNLAYYPNVGLTTGSLRRDSDLGLAVVSVDGGGCFWLPSGSLQSH